MPDNPLIDQISERVERLLLRHGELLRTNELLAEQVRQLTHERDNLKSRLLAARARVDALIDRLPPQHAEGERQNSRAEGGREASREAAK